MLSRTPDLIEGVIEISHQRKWLDLSIAAIKFAQCVAQGLWTNSHSLEQLPYISEAELKLITKSSNNKPQAKTLGEYLRIPDAEKKGLAQLTEEQRTEVLRVCNIITHLKVETKLFVEEEEKDFLEGEDDTPATVAAAAASKAVVKKTKTQADEEEEAKALAVTGDKIYEQDLVTLRITLTRENVTEGDNAPPVYAPHFPTTLKESWWVVLTDKTNKSEAGQSARTAGSNSNINIHAFEKVTDQRRQIVHEVRFMAPQRAGSYEMELQIFSDCYIGLDHSIPVPFTVHPASELPEFKMHPEDQELDNEPTLFEQVMAANVDESSDEEGDDEEEEEEEEQKDKDKKKAAVVKKSSSAVKGGSKNQSVIVEDASDSEEEN